jgi:prepilin-type N-terminal cleavage/methylation domain-containing protein/prepilin-type processing-associated H-X9-DG protein
MKPKRAFTLIELLVVIAIIALLLAIVMPVLNKAKVIAAAVVCMSNNSSASKAWLSYAEDYKGFLMDGDQSENADGKQTYTLNGTSTQVTVWCFVAAPQDLSGTVIKRTVEDEIRGLAKGALWSYMGGAFKAYNCPADKRWTKAPTDMTNRRYSAEFGGYRTFSIGGVLSKRMLSSDGVASNEIKYVVTKWSEFVNPSGKFVFLEEFDPRGINHRTWNVNLTQPKWTDALAMVHNGASTFAYADGHAERYKWTGPDTKKFFNVDNQLIFNVPNGPVLTDAKDIEDYNWFVRHYIPGKK